MGYVKLHNEIGCKVGFLLLGQISYHKYAFFLDFAALYNEDLLRNTSILGKYGAFLFPYNGKTMERKLAKVFHVQCDGTLLVQNAFPI